MRCRTCDYPLWNLPARQCPECGTAFKPSDFHFLHNAVRFCCPHCEQSYYGTGEHGHLVPPEFNCVTCGQRITMDQCVLQPAAGVQEEQAQTDIMPWLERKRRGWIKGWFKTVGMAMVAPQKLMRAVPPKSPNGDAWLFGFVTQTLVCGVGAALPLSVFGAVAMANGDPSGLSMLLTAASLMVFGSLATLLIAWLWALTAHGLLRITGGCAYGLGRTMQAILYSSGTNAPLGVPCIGLYCGGWMLWIWWLISAILMVVEGQRVRGFRATCCVAAFPLLLVVTMFGGYFAFLFFVFSQVNAVNLQSAANSGSYLPSAEAATIATALTDFASQHNGKFPGHGLQLMTDGTLGATDFMVWQVGHDENKVPVNTGTLVSFQLLGANRAAMEALDAANALPANVVAHRLGDVVFTYHGMNANTANHQLWIAIIDGDPDQASTSTGTMTPVAVSIDGSLTALPRQTISGILQNQNALRAQYGLAPLPDPSTVTHALPAAAPVSGG